MAITTGDSATIFLAAFVLMALIYTAPKAIWPSFYAEMFDAYVRCGGTAIGTRLGFLSAGFTLVIRQTLLRDGVNGWVPVVIFIALCCVISAAAAATARGTKSVDIGGLGKNRNPTR